MFLVLLFSKQYFKATFACFSLTPDNIQARVSMNAFSAFLKVGVENADAALFQGREIILTPLPGTNPTAIETVSAMWALTGGYIRHMSVTAARA